MTIIYLFFCGKISIFVDNFQEVFHFKYIVYFMYNVFYHLVCGESKLKSEINSHRGKRDVSGLQKRQITDDGDT